ncbi:hypothetical protein [Shewanella mangrovisoli]|uniref:hypothetical protein n=1 Tax=Shewanella mangrovisoli TaxID=2864211 RepID=UPI001C660F63|nr:hypothetical protein [Shewanella mangrovisoli]QYK07563.1 hypothetical protein K0H60_11995 [Shewanella mangrovisoli]
MTRIIQIIAAKDRPLNQACVDVVAANDAERIIIMDRVSAEVFHNFRFQSNKTMKFIVPLRFATSSDLLVGILDDDRSFNAKFLDGRQADLINGNQVNIRS